MGDFRGHSLVGSAFLLFGLWWAIKYPLLYLRGVPRGRTYRRMEMAEGGVKFVFALIGAVVENYAPTGPRFHLVDPGSGTFVGVMGWQHSTMYIFFVLSGLVDLLSYSNLKLPQGLDRLALALAIFMEGLLMSSHTKLQPPLEGLCHSMLLLVASAGFLCLALEVFLRDHIVLQLFRTSLAILQGSWFWQIGFVMFPPCGAKPWDQNDHHNAAFIPILFYWHYAVAFLITLTAYVTLHCLLSRNKNPSDRDNIEFQKLDESTADTTTHLLPAWDKD